MSTTERKVEMADILTNTGQSLDELSRSSPVLVVFLRHAGCPFCRETLAKLEKRRAEIEQQGAKIVLVHMIELDNEAEMFFARYRLHDVARISDPQQEVYKRFGLPRGRLSQVMGPGIWWSGLKSLLSGNMPGKPIGDIFQLPGAFLVHQGQLVKRFQPSNSAEQTDYVELAAGCGSSTGC